MAGALIIIEVSSACKIIYSGSLLSFQKLYFLSAFLEITSSESTVLHCHQSTISFNNNNITEVGPNSSIR